jgi:hypothetical protein
VQNSLKVFQFLWSLKEIGRQQVYESVVSVGPANTTLLGRLLETDFDPAPDQELLHAVLLKAVAFTDRIATAMILQRLQPFKSTNYAFSLFQEAICSERDASKDVFTALLEHVDKGGFDINSRFTHRAQSLRLSECEGQTLLHVAFGRGRIDLAIVILERGGDASLLSLDEQGTAGQTPLGHLLWTRSHHNYLALCRFIDSDFVKTRHPAFLLDNAVIKPQQNYNIFHQLCQGEDERVHNHNGYKLSTLNELIKHFKALSFAEPAAEVRFRELLNERMILNGEDGFTPLLLAVSSGFDRAIPLLFRNGADPCVRIGEDTESGYSGVTALVAFDSRSPKAFMLEFKEKTARLRRGGSAWIHPKSPVAAKMTFEYDERSERTLVQLKQVMESSDQGRMMWEKWTKFKESADGETATLGFWGYLNGLGQSCVAM